jgi:hypothetical protein
MEYRASDTGREEPRDTGPEEYDAEEMGRKDFIFATSVMVVLILAAIVVAIVWG